METKEAWIVFGVEILKMFLQAVITFVSVFLGYRFSLALADESRRREYALKELDAFQRRVGLFFDEIDKLPKSVSDDDDLHCKESQCKEQNRKKVLEAVDWIREKRHFLNELLVSNKIKGDDQRNFLQAIDDVISCLSGDDFTSGNWWLPTNVDKYNLTQNYLFQSIDKLKIVLLGCRATFWNRLL